MTSGQRAEPKDAPTAATTECPIEAHTALQRKAARRFTGRSLAEKTPRKVSGMTSNVPSRTAVMRSNTCR